VRDSALFTQIGAMMLIMAWCEN